MAGLAAFAATAAHPHPLPAAEAGADVAAASGEEVLARVNGIEISRGSVMRRLITMIQDRGMTATAEDLSDLDAKLVSAVVDEMVVEALLSQAADAAEIEVGGAEVDQAIETFKGSLPPDVDFLDYLRLYSATEPMVRRDLERNLRVKKLVEKLTASVGRPSEEQLKSFYDGNAERFKVPARVLAREILLSTAGLEGEAPVAERGKEALEVRGRLVGESAEPFAEVAKEVSDGETAEAGGLLEPFSPDGVSPQLGAAAMKQPVGAVGPVFYSDAGFHILLVEDRVAARTIPFEEAKPDIARMLMAEEHNGLMLAYIEELRSRAEIERFDRGGEPTGG